MIVHAIPLIVITGIKHDKGELSAGEKWLRRPQPEHYNLTLYSVTDDIA